MGAYPQDRTFLAHLLVSFCPMFKAGTCHCDVCGKVISRGESYFVRLVPREQIPSKADMSGFTFDSRGNVLVDVCLACKEGMGLGGKEMMA